MYEQSRFFNSAAQSIGTRTTKAHCTVDYTPQPQPISPAPAPCYDDHTQIAEQRVERG